MLSELIDKLYLGIRKAIWGPEVLWDDGTYTPEGRPNEERESLIAHEVFELLLYGEEVEDDDEDDWYTESIPPYEIDPATVVLPEQEPYDQDEDETL